MIRLHHFSTIAFFCNFLYAFAQQEEAPKLQIRLADGDNENSGRVEMTWYGLRKGTMCSNGFDQNAAAVICRMLGLNPMGAMVRFDFGPARDQRMIVMATGAKCYGDEDDLLECWISQWYPFTNCTHLQDVGVECGPSTGTPSRGFQPVLPMNPPPRPESRPAPVSPQVPVNPGQPECRDPFMASVNAIGPYGGRVDNATDALSLRELRSNCETYCIRSAITCHGFDFRFGTCYLYLYRYESRSLRFDLGINYLRRNYTCLQQSLRRFDTFEGNQLGCFDTKIDNIFILDTAFVYNGDGTSCGDLCLRSSIRCYGFVLSADERCFLLLYRFNFGLGDEINTEGSTFYKRTC